MSVFLRGRAAFCKFYCVSAQLCPLMSPVSTKCLTVFAINSKLIDGKPKVVQTFPYHASDLGVYLPAGYLCVTGSL